MNYDVNETHDPALRSWVDSANDPESDFPVQNLPFGVFRPHGADEEPRVGVAIGDQILDIPACRDAGLMTGPVFTAAVACEVPALNSLMSLERGQWSTLRHRVSEILRVGSADREVAGRTLIPMDRVEMQLPVHIGDYTDFYASVFHATNVGSMFRPDNPLLPNYKYVPVAYHGRASSVVVSGTPIRRPHGQVVTDDAAVPEYRPTRLLDYELEVGLFLGSGTPLGSSIPLERAEDHVFGLCLVNDWSARDIQKWEYQPLGPFLAKNFGTTVSPWVVSLEALAPFRCEAYRRPEGDPAPLAHLSSARNEQAGGIELTLEVLISSAKMREAGLEPVRVSRGSFRDMYWTIAQMLAHHTSNGCNTNAGDLLASGTVSGPAEDSRGCLLELTWRGTSPVQLPTGEQRRFLEDGDEVIMMGYCEREGYRRIGFGECRGRIEPAQDV